MGSSAPEYAMLRAVHETKDDLRNLQRSLDASYAGAGEHIRSIFRPERRMSAEEIVEELRGVFVLHLATVTARAEPRLAPIDGLFFRGHLWFGIPPGAVRQAHVRARPQVSASYSRGEELCILAHGEARVVSEVDPAYAEYLQYAREVYTPALFDHWEAHYEDRKGETLTAWIEPRRLFAMKAAD
jgi:hypothetical protein